ncbi:Legumain-like [Homarus americanus]|uniref:legumain n=1 Tax=Homarus americanus TaxID=6706 RepID=A0A8J5NAE6_HOMAM|nr:Legumain-like [Homarus americanus]
MRWVALALLVGVVGVVAGIPYVHNVDSGEGEVWAVLILHQHGVADDHIIVMMYDDIANSKENPHPGQIINRPGGPNVYPGVPKDYTGANVNLDNFLKVLKGDSEGLKGVGSGKVLKSGPNDRVFINLVDHGAPGLFALIGDILTTTNLTDAILSMHHNKQYKELTLYVESCESGSLFQKLPHDINVYAVSASNATESSYACYFEAELKTFLGDVFSIKWMEDTDRENVAKETLKKQYHVVESETKTSHVLQWGQISIDTEKVGAFVGSYKTGGDGGDKSSITSPDVPLALIQTHIQDSQGLIGSTFWHQEMDELKKNRTFVRDTMQKIIQQVTRDTEVTTRLMTDHHNVIFNHECYESSVMTFHNLCFNLGHNPYALRVVYALVNLCEHGYTAQEFTCSARAVCDFEPVIGIN